MTIISNICTILGLILLCLGVLMYVFEIVGIIKYKFVLNRMHVAGMGDTLALLLSMAGLMLISGINFTTLKFGLIVVFLWFTSPTSSHLISGLEALTDDEVGKYAEVQVDDLKSCVDGFIEDEEE